MSPTINPSDVATSITLYSVLYAAMTFLDPRIVPPGFRVDGVEQRHPVPGRHFHIRAIMG